MKYNVNNKWITKEEWEAIIVDEYEQIMKYQEMSRYGVNKNGNDCYMGIELIKTIEEEEC
jgi:hypothetical protein